MSDSRHVFTYGSLMFDEVWLSVVSGRYASQSAQISGFSRKRVVGEEYPALIPVEGDHPTVVGRLYFDVSLDDLAYLDDFEGDQYDRQSAPIITEKGEKLNAQVYVWRPEFNDLASQIEWRAEEFEETGLRIFRERYKGFR